MAETAVANTDLRELLSRRDLETEIASLTVSADDLLAEDAAKVLGYKRLETKAPSIRRKQQLLTALKAENIRPFTSESVETYKQAVVDAHTTYPWHYRLANPINKSLEQVSPGWFVLWFLATLVSIVVGIGAWMGAATSWCFYPLASGIFSALFITFLVTGDSSAGSWQMVPIEEYTGESDVPKMALHRAIALIKRLPGAKICVDEYRKDLPVDPFIVVQHGGWQEYIDVWSETYVPVYQPDQQ